MNIEEMKHLIKTNSLHLSKILTEDNYDELLFNYKENARFFDLFPFIGKDKQRYFIKARAISHIIDRDKEIVLSAFRRGKMIGYKDIMGVWKTTTYHLEDWLSVYRNGAVLEGNK